MKNIICAFAISLLLVATGCATITAGEQILGDKDKATATVIFGLENRHSGVSKYGRDSTIMRLSTKEEYEISYSDGRNVHAIKVLHLPPDSYAFVENSSVMSIGTSVEAITVSELPEDAPYFAVLPNERLYLGNIVYDYVASTVRVKNKSGETKKFLAEAGYSTDFTYSPIALSAQDRERFSTYAALPMAQDEELRGK